MINILCIDVNKLNVKHTIFILVYQIHEMTNFYDQICNLFIRPSRQTYTSYDLGSPIIHQNGSRQNFSLLSRKNYQLKCSFYKNKLSEHNSCVLYLHSFNGSRLQSLRYIPDILENGMHFCHFDFAGCGNSGGDFVSLGCNQTYDAIRVIQYVHNKYQIQQFFLWGRSMGAVTAIKINKQLKKRRMQNGQFNIRILGMVLDSPFISLKQMVVNVGQKKMNLPQFVTKALFLIVSSSIQERAKFKTEELELHQELAQIKCQVLILTSKQDSFVSYTHAEEIFNRLSITQSKDIYYISGEHYETRSKDALRTIYNFFKKKNKKVIGEPIHGHLNQQANKFAFSQQRLNQKNSIQKNSQSLKKYQYNYQQYQQPRKSELINFNQMPQKDRLERVKTTQNYVTYGHNHNVLSQEMNFQILNSDKKLYDQRQPSKKILISDKQTNSINYIHYNNMMSASSSTKALEVIDRKGHEQHTIIDQKQESNDKQAHYNIIGTKLRKKGKLQRGKARQIKPFDITQISLGTRYNRLQIVSKEQSKMEPRSNPIKLGRNQAINSHERRLSLTNNHAAAAVNTVSISKINEERIGYLTQVSPANQNIDQYKTIAKNCPQNYKTNEISYKVPKITFTHLTPQNNRTNYE